jgi:uncharacterized protein (TIRG00374 family)
MTAGPGRRRRSVRALATLAVTALSTAYVVWKVDLERTLDVLADAALLPLAGALAILLLAIPPLAWRWRLLLAARGIHDRLPWLTRAYFVSYAAGQVLPTSLGGDAMRIFETARRHRAHAGTVAGSVLLERVLGGFATLVLGAVGFALAVGRYDVGAYLWLELVLLLAAVVLGLLLFTRSARRPLRRVAPLLARFRLDRPLRAVYEGVHAYRAEPRLLLSLFALTLAVQALRILSIWLTAKSAGVDLSPLPFYVMGPLFFVVMLVPFTINGLAVREAFFVSFLGQLGVAPEPAFATGFLYFLLSLALAVPGAVILLTEGGRSMLRPTRAERRSSSE